MACLSGACTSGLAWHFLAWKTSLLNSMALMSIQSLRSVTPSIRGPWFLHKNAETWSEESKLVMEIGNDVRAGNF